MAVSLVGLLVSLFYLPQFSVDWAAAFGILSAIMLASSFVAMAKGDPERQLGKKRVN